MLMVEGNSHLGRLDRTCNGHDDRLFQFSNLSAGLTSPGGPGKTSKDEWLIAYDFFYRNRRYILGAHIPHGLHLGRQRKQADETGRIGMVVDRRMSEGGKLLAVQAVGALAPGDNDIALVQLERDRARDRLLRLEEEGIHAPGAAG